MPLESVKTVVQRFNSEVIQVGDRGAFESLMATDFINHSAPPGADAGAEGMWATFEHILRPALSDLRVEILAQIAEDDLVSTRKRITGLHTGTLMGIPATGRAITINVLDMVRVRDGRYVEHWGMNTLAAELAKLREAT